MHYAPVQYWHSLRMQKDMASWWCCMGRSPRLPVVGGTVALCMIIVVRNKYFSFYGLQVGQFIRDQDGNKAWQKERDQAIDALKTPLLNTRAGAGYWKGFGKTKKAMKNLARQTARRKAILDGFLFFVWKSPRTRRKIHHDRGLFPCCRDMRKFHWYRANNLVVFFGNTSQKIVQPTYRCFYFIKQLSFAFRPFIPSNDDCDWQQCLHMSHLLPWTYVPIESQIYHH